MCTSISTKKGSVLTCELYHLFQEYIRGGCTNVPDSRLLEAMVSEPVNNAAKRKRLRKKFKSWAARLAVRPLDGRLVYKSTGKLIVPEEFFIPTIERSHSCNGLKHLTLSQTIDAIMGEYSVGKREFGIDRDLIVAVVNHCSHPDCQRAFFQRQHHRNNSQGQEHRKQSLSLKLYSQNEETQASASAIVKREELDEISNSGYILPNDVSTEDINMEESSLAIENPCNTRSKMVKCKHSQRFTPIQPKPPPSPKVFYVNNNKKHSKNNSCHIPVRFVPVPRGICATPRVFKTDTKANSSNDVNEEVILDKSDKQPAKVDELYLLLLKRIQMIRRVLRPSLSTNSTRLQDVMRTYINDGVGIIQRLRHDVSVTPNSNTTR